MNARTLVLTPWYLPYRVVSWEDAITLVYLDKVEVVASYAEVVRSPSVSLALPAVIRMKKRISTHRYRIRFSRVNVFMRDGFRCMYCGRECTARELTFDHVVPRSQGGRTEWINILSACNGCNTLKGNRTPAQAGMVPIRRPFKPDTLPMRPQRLDLGRIPQEWRDYCVNLDTAQAFEPALEVIGASAKQHAVRPQTSVVEEPARHSKTSGKFQRTPSAA